MSLYSPDHNPIELNFYTLKAWIKQHYWVRPRCQDLSDLGLAAIRPLLKLRARKGSINYYNQGFKEQQDYVESKVSCSEPHGLC